MRTWQHYGFFSRGSGQANCNFGGHYAWISLNCYHSLVFTFFLRFSTNKQETGPTAPAPLMAGFVGRIRPPALPLTSSVRTSSRDSIQQVSGVTVAGSGAGAGAELFIKFHKATSVFGVSSLGSLHMTRKKNTTTSLGGVVSVCVFWAEREMCCRGLGKRLPSNWPHPLAPRYTYVYINKRRGIHSQPDQINRKVVMFMLWFHVVWKHKIFRKPRR